MTNNPEHPGIELATSDASGEVWADAARVAARLLPRLTDIVRTSAGDNGIQVSVNSAGHGPCTDGSTVHLPLDPGWAKIDPNNPCVCDTEPESCLYHITVGLLLHEAAHISEGSTKPCGDEFFQQLSVSLADLMDVLPDGFVTDFCERHSEDSLKRVDNCVGAKQVPKSPLEVASWFNPDAPLMSNAFEDARINLRVGDKRSALGQQMQRLVEGLISRAVTGGGITEGPLGYQIGVAVEIELEHGYDLKPALRSEAVLTCLKDKVVRQMLEEFPLVTVADSVACGIMLTEYARETYGLFDHDMTPETAEGSGRAASKPLQSGKDLADDGKLKESQRLRDKKELGRQGAELVDRARSTSEAEKTGRKKWHRESHDSVGDAPGMAEIAEALNASRQGQMSESVEAVMQEPGGGGVVGESGEGSYKPVILRPDYENTCDGSQIKLLDDYRYPAGGGFERSSELEVKVQTPVQQAQRKLADALGMNRRSASTPNLVRGRLHGSKLARVATGNRRVFRRIDKPRKRSYAVLIGVDQSGSTYGMEERQLVELAYAQATLLDRLGVPFAVAGHTGSGYDCEHAAEESFRERVTADFGGQYAHLATIQLVKNFAEPWDEAAKSGVGALHASHQNLDGLTMRTYIDMLCTQRATDRILLYYTDGAMPAEDPINQKVMLEAQCRRAKAMQKLPDRRVHVVGIGLNTDSPSQYGLDTIEVDGSDMEAGVTKVVEGLAERIASSIRG